MNLNFKHYIRQISIIKFNEARNKAKELNTILVSYEYKSSNTDLKSYLSNVIYKKISFNAICDKWINRINSKTIRQITRIKLL